jgi:hypothetical protein
VTAVTVTVSAVTAPNATTERRCTAQDFQALPYRADGPLRLDARTTATLSQLGVPDVRLPAIKMLNRPVNQDGCKGAEVHLRYRITATPTTLRRARNAVTQRRAARRA